MQDNIERLARVFEENRNEANGGPMKKYMKDHFPFLGIKSPFRKALEKQFFKETGILKEPFNKELIIEFWEKAEREYQYTALAYIEKASIYHEQNGDNVQIIMLECL